MAATAPSPVIPPRPDEFRQAGKAAARHNVSDYYRQTIEDYQTWSREGYMHFGLWRPGLNPLNRKSMLEAMNDLVFDQLHLATTDPLNVGDFGCGLGAVSRYGATWFPHHRWQAVTICPEQTTWGRAHLPPPARPRVRIETQDFQAMTIPDHSLDAGFFLESFCHATSMEQALRECARVIRPGGRLVIVDGMMRNPAQRTPRLAGWLSRTVADHWAVPGFPRRGAFEQAVRLAGFEILVRRELGWQIAPCVAHSPLLVAWHSLRLMATGQWTAWKRRHMIGCALGVLLGLCRRQFGYFAYTLRHAGPDRSSA